MGDPNTSGSLWCRSRRFLSASSWSSWPPTSSGSLWLSTWSPFTNPFLWKIQAHISNYHNQMCCWAGWDQILKYLLYRHCIVYKKSWAFYQDAITWSRPLASTGFKIIFLLRHEAQPNVWENMICAPSRSWSRKRQQSIQGGFSLTKVDTFETHSSPQTSSGLILLYDSLWPLKFPQGWILYCAERPGIVQRRQFRRDRVWWLGC